MNLVDDVTSKFLVSNSVGDYSSLHRRANYPNEVGVIVNGIEWHRGEDGATSPRQSRRPRLLPFVVSVFAQHLGQLA